MIECDVIRDLMPLYVEGLASEASRRVVETHTVCCPECRRQLEAMGAPLEQDASLENKNYIEAIRRENEKNIRRTLKGCAAVLLVCVLVWWGYMEINFSGERIDYTVMEEAKILKEEPRLVLTEEEKRIGETLLSMESIRALMGTGEIHTVPFDQVEHAIQEWLPRNAEFAEIGVYNASVSYDYTVGDTRVLMEFGDPDGDGIPDRFYKLVATAVRPGSNDVDVVYELSCNAETGETEYRKNVSRHDWFSFLRNP